MKKILFSVLLLGSLLPAAADIPALTPEPREVNPSSWWVLRFNENIKRAKAGGSKVVFIGDSITHFWEAGGSEQWKKYFAGAPYHALNLGYSADRTEHVLWRIAHGELDGYEAKAIVLMIGTNNAGHRPFEKEPPADTIVGIKAVLKAIRAKQPQAKIILLPIFPRGMTVQDACRVRNNIVNKEIRAFADGKTILWCDFTQQFLTPDGVLSQEIMPDFLHPGPFGYEIWAAAVMPYIDWALTAKEGETFPQRFAPWISPAQFALEGSRTVIPMTRVNQDNAARGRGWWEDRLARNRNAIANANGTFDIVFFGDSITHFWEREAPRYGAGVYAELCKTYKILNLGYGGDRTEHLVWRGLNGELDGYKAKLVMLMIGTNNGRDSAPAVAEGIKRVIEVIKTKQPQAKILLLPIFPRNASADDNARVKNNEVNKIIRGYADGTNVLWLDFNAKYLDADGRLLKALMPDMLHPNEEGYRIWRDAVLPIFRDVVGK